MIIYIMLCKICKNPIIKQITFSNLFKKLDVDICDNCFDRNYIDYYEFLIPTKLNIIYVINFIIFENDLILDCLISKIIMKLSYLNKKVIIIFNIDIEDETIFSLFDEINNEILIINIEKIR